MQRSARPRVVIIGAGFGGLAAGQIAPPIRKNLRRHRNVDVTLAEATGIDLPASQVQLEGVDGQSHRLGYDYLIVASGAVDSYFGHDQWAKHSYPMKTLAQAVALRDRILSTYERAASSTPSTPSRPRSP